MWINFASCFDEILQSDFHRSEKEAKRRKNKKIEISLSTLSLFTLSSLPRPFDFSMFFRFYLFLFFFNYYYYYYYFGYIVHIALFGSVSVSKQFIFFLVHFILNELNPSHFLTSEIFIKILSLKLLTTYHLENRKIFRLSQNSNKLFWVTKFRQKNLTVQSISSFKI